MDIPKKLKLPRLATSSKKGFSLIEAVVASAILGVAILSLTQILALGLKVIETNQKKLADILSAQALIEEELAKPYDAIVSHDEIMVTEMAQNLKQIEAKGLLKTLKVRP